MKINRNLVEAKLKVIIGDIYSVMRAYTNRDLSDLSEALEGRWDENNGLIDFDYGDFTFTIFDDGGVHKLSDSVDYYPDASSCNVYCLNLKDYTHNTSTDKGLMLNALELFNDSAFKLLVAWDNYDIDDVYPRHLTKYPFNESFDEVYSSIFNWVEDVVEGIQNPPSVSLLKPFIDKAKVDGRVRVVITKGDGMSTDEWRIDKDISDEFIINDLKELIDDYYTYYLSFDNHGRIRTITIDLLNHKSAINNNEIDIFKVLNQIQSKDPLAYVEVIAVNGHMKDSIGIAHATKDGNVNLTIGEDGSDDRIISKERFNEYYRIIGVQWS